MGTIRLLTYNLLVLSRVGSISLFISSYCCLIFYHLLFLFFHRARGSRRGLEGEQLDHFIQEKFRSVCTGEKENKDGVKEFVLDWTHEGKKLCRRSYSLLFNIPKNRFDNCSSAMKAAGTMFPSAINVTSWKDTHIHNYTFAETEELFKRNLANVKVVGTQLKYIFKLIV